MLARLCGPTLHALAFLRNNDSTMDALDAVIAYHEATKHHPGRFARSPGQLDWAKRPEPFRRFEGAPLHPLPLVAGDPTPPYDALFSGGIPEQPLTRDTLGSLFEHALGLSAWKEYRGERWALRCNPSSGNLHPTEGYALLPPIPGIHDGPAVYHYAPREHVLERRADLTPDSWNALAAVLPENAFLLGLSSIHWREAWKYGERAFRYCQHDLGHAFAALAISAAALGWSMRRLDSPADAELTGLLGLARLDDFPPGEHEHPGLLAAVFPGATTAPSFDIPPEVFASAATSAWHGHAEALSTGHVSWAAIDDVARATAKPRTAAQPPQLPPQPAPTAHPAKNSARTIIRRRRSAVAMDGHTACPRDTFYRILARLMPDRSGPLWSAFAATPQVDLIFFVHRVKDLHPGLYGLLRNPGHEPRLRDAMQADFVWSKPAECPEDLPFYLLTPGDCRRLAGQLCCGQAIAADGAFAAAMLAAFEHRLQQVGPWAYRALFQETGLLGQLLYLEAEAAGLRGTGIGCFFDDLVHEILGLRDRQFQSLYHFTVGGPVDDPRLSTLPPYPEHE